MCLSCPLLCLVGLLCLTGLSAFTTEEQALLQFAEQISNFDVSYLRSLKQAAQQAARQASYSFLADLYAPSDNCTKISCIAAFQEVYETRQWQGWGKDSNVLCPSAEVNTDNEYLCFPNYPGDINVTSQSWTGIVCTPNGTVLCISLAGWGLTGNVGVLEELVPLQDMQLLNLANNSLTGAIYQHC